MVEKEGYSLLFPFSPALKLIFLRSRKSLDDIQEARPINTVAHLVEYKKKDILQKYVIPDLMPVHNVFQKDCILQGLKVVLVCFRMIQSEDLWQGACTG